MMSEQQKQKQLVLTNYNMVGIYQYNIKNPLDSMQQKGFLSKLYEIKPFKVVESPQTIKNNQNLVQSSKLGSAGKSAELRPSILKQLSNLPQQTYNVSGAINSNGTVMALGSGANAYSNFPNNITKTGYGNVTEYRQERRNDQNVAFPLTISKNTVNLNNQLISTPKKPHQPKMTPNPTHMFNISNIVLNPDTQQLIKQKSPIPYKQTILNNSNSKQSNKKVVVHLTRNSSYKKLEAEKAIRKYSVQEPCSQFSASNGINFNGNGNGSGYGLVDNIAQVQNSHSLFPNQNGHLQDINTMASVQYGNINMNSLQKVSINLNNSTNKYGQMIKSINLSSPVNSPKVTPKKQIKITFPQTSIQNMNITQQEKQKQRQKQLMNIFLKYKKSDSIPNQPNIGHQQKQIYESKPKLAISDLQSQQQKKSQSLSRSFSKKQSKSRSQCKSKTVSSSEMQSDLHNNMSQRNNLPCPSMIQSHLYTNLSSSIDTLFTKLQKIKQQFQCPLKPKLQQQQHQQTQPTQQTQPASLTTSTPLQSLYAQQSSQQLAHPRVKNLQQFNMIKVDSGSSQFSGYSPIIKPTDCTRQAPDGLVVCGQSLSSLSLNSFSSCLKNPLDNKNNNQNYEKAYKPCSTDRIVYSNHSQTHSLGNHPNNHNQHQNHSSKNNINNNSNNNKDKQKQDKEHDKFEQLYRHSCNNAPNPGIHALNSNHQHKPSHHHYVPIHNHTTHHPQIKKQRNHTLSDISSINSQQLMWAPCTSPTNSMTILPATHISKANPQPHIAPHPTPLPSITSIKEMSSKTRSIIDDINLLLQSGNKNANNVNYDYRNVDEYKEEKKFKLRKMYTCNNGYDNQPMQIDNPTKNHQDNRQNQQTKMKKVNNNIVNINNGNNPNHTNKNTTKVHQYDQLDDQFMLIKLKPTQSEYPPQITHQNSGGNTQGQSGSAQKAAPTPTNKNPAKQHLNAQQIKPQNLLGNLTNLNYKLEKPSQMISSKNQCDRGKENQKGKEKDKDVRSEYICGSEVQSINYGQKSREFCGQSYDSQEWMNQARIISMTSISSPSNNESKSSDLVSNHYNNTKYQNISIIKSSSNISDNNSLAYKYQNHKKQLSQKSQVLVSSLNNLDRVPQNTPATPKRQNKIVNGSGFADNSSLPSIPNILTPSKKNKSKFSKTSSQMVSQSFYYANTNQVSKTIPPVSPPLSMRQFTLGKCIGSGKFGDVYICKHKPTNLLFALKKIFKSTIKQYNMIAQFTQQLKIHYTLSYNNNPNITKLYTHFQDQYHIFLLMQYIQDGTLMQKLKSPEHYVSNIILQVLNVVEYLHRNNVTHRDIKPENILLSNGVVKLCDFGWSSFFKDEMKKTFCGTLDYVSPQMKDRGEYTTSVDLWSIGILTFQLLTGFPPHKKQIDKWKIKGGKIETKWKWDVIYPPQLSQLAKQFIQKLLKQDPEQRISIRQCRQQDFIKKYNSLSSSGYLYNYSDNGFDCNKEWVKQMEKLFM